MTLAEVPTPPPFENDLTDPIDFECDQGYGIYHVVSAFGETGFRRKRYFEEADRRWGFGCQKVKKMCASTVLNECYLGNNSNAVCS